MIAGFVTRADAELARPRSVSRNIDPFGVAIHYGGPAQRIGSHDDCLTRWKAWQNYHMNTHGWVDIAYSGGFCDHGYAFAGRGFGIRTAANGTDHANGHYYAYCWIGGAGEEPTDGALDAAAWWVREARRAGGAGPDVQPHSAFKSTSCPGPLTVRLGLITSRAAQSDTTEEHEMNALPLVKLLDDDRIWVVYPGLGRAHVQDWQWKLLPDPRDSSANTIRRLPAGHQVWDLPVLDGLPSGGSGHTHETVQVAGPPS